MKLTDQQIARIRQAVVALLDGARVRSGPNTWQLADDGKVCLVAVRRTCAGPEEILLTNDLPFGKLCDLLCEYQPVCDFTFRDRAEPTVTFTNSRHDL